MANSGNRHRATCIGTFRSLCSQLQDGVQSMRMRPIVIDAERGLSVCLSVCLVVITMNHTKTDEQSEVPFGK